jgi:outer membrane protein
MFLALPMRRSFLLLSALVLFGLNAASANAQTTGVESERMAVVDVAKLLSESTLAAAARNAIETRLAPEKARLDALKDEIKRGSEDLKKQSALLAESALAQKTAALEQKQRDAERVFEDLRIQAEKENQAMLGKVMERVQSAVQKVAAAKNCRFVLQKDKFFVVYAAERLDVTAEVLAELNKEKANF